MDMQSYNCSQQATIPLESLIIPLMALSNRDKRWIADRLYSELEARPTPSCAVDYSSMPGQFTEEEKQCRMMESYCSTEENTVEDVERMLSAL